MSGELEKRINKMLILSSYGPHRDVDTEYQRKRISQIIDEMRKELPKIGDIDKSEYEHEYVAIEEWIGKLGEWLKKWLETKEPM